MQNFVTGDLQDGIIRHAVFVFPTIPVRRWLVAHDGVDALLDVAQHLGGRGSSATAGGNSPACARATWPAKVASRISRWLRRNRGRAIRSCSSGPQRRANEDAHALQTVACCDGLPRESLVAFATVILDTLFTE